MNLPLVGWVAVGGAIGAVSRYGVTLVFARWFGAGFPWGTLVVNGVGSFVLGVLVEAALSDPRISPGAKALIGTGFCGGLTTFSTFSVETLRMPPALALPNVAANLGLSLATAWIGISLVRTLHSMAEGV